MPKTSRPSGNWGDNQKKDLRDLVDANEIDIARKDASYLWEICNLPPFQPFISEASTGKRELCVGAHSPINKNKNQSRIIVGYLKELAPVDPDT